MAYEKFYSPVEDFFGWRCLSCGEIVVRLFWRIGSSKGVDAEKGNKASLNFRQTQIPVLFFVVVLQSIITTYPF